MKGAGSDFASRLVQETRRLGTPLCVGIDPHLDKIPALFRIGDMDYRKPQTAEAVAAFCHAFIERLVGRVGIIKPQIAFFEQLGWRGLRVLEEVARSARRSGLLVVLDAKRGDIGSTSEAYANSYLTPGSFLESDALTVQPYMGMDALEPFIARAEEYGRGLFVLVRTSNQGARDFQDQNINGEPLYLRVARVLAKVSERLNLSGEWSNLGIVVGATYPEQALKLREVLPRSLFLVPGYGAQGASAVDSLSGFVPGPDGILEGGIVNTSRMVLFPQTGYDTTVKGWEKAIDDTLGSAVSNLSEVMSRS